MNDMEKKRPDIESREDIERLVRAFYDRAMVDDRIGYIFTEVAKIDLDEHLPTMFDFWETMLLGGNRYRGGAMHKHVDLHRQSPLLEEHFVRWLELWDATIDRDFAGDRASLAKMRAHQVARSMLLRMPPPEGSGERRFDTLPGGRPGAGGLPITRAAPAATRAARRTGAGREEE